jgi:metallo-beta-lactamase class B
MRKLIALAFVASAAAGVSAQYKPVPEWNQPAKPHRIIGNVYYVGTTELTSVLIATPRGHILIDPSLVETVPLIKNSVRALGFKYEDIKLLLTTQAHYDHAAGLALVKRETGARMEAMVEDAALLEAGGKGDFRFGDELTFPAVKVDRVLRDGDIVELGGVKLVARHTPGHTKGAATYVTTVEEGGKPYQFVASTSVSVNEGTALLNNPKYPAIVSDWEKTYSILKSLKPDVWVSSHAMFFDMKGKSARSGPPNPYIDPDGYRRFIAQGEERFRKLLADERASLRQ